MFVRGGRCRGIILHSDRGSLYTAYDMVAACPRHGLRRSMGVTGICWDDAGSESQWSRYKHECYYRHVYPTRAELVAAGDNWMRFYVCHECGREFCL